MANCDLKCSESRDKNKDNWDERKEEDILIWSGPEV